VRGLTPPAADACSPSHGRGQRARRALTDAARLGGGAWDDVTQQTCVQRCTTLAAPARLRSPPPPLPPPPPALQNPALANAERNTPLHWACLNGQAAAARALLQAGASASALNAHDATPVDAALDRGHQDVVDIINEFNAPSKEVEELEVPDDAEEAAGEGDMQLDDGVPGGDGA
jgi:hypothetical protein